MLLPEHVKVAINHLLDKIEDESLDVKLRSRAAWELYRQFVYKGLVIPRIQDVLLRTIESTIHKVGPPQGPICCHIGDETLDPSYLGLLEAMVPSITWLRGAHERPDSALLHQLLNLAETSTYSAVKAKIIAACCTRGASADESVARRVLDMLSDPSMRPVYSTIIDGIHHCGHYEGFVEAIASFAKREPDGQLAGRAIDLLCEWWQVGDHPAVVEAIQSTKAKVLAVKFDPRRKKLLELIQLNNGPQNLDLSNQSLYSIDLSRDMILEELRRFSLQSPGKRPAWISETTLGINLRRVNLAKAHLRHARLQGADLSESDLSEADLTQAKLTDAVLTLANLSYASLVYAEMLGTHLAGADLSRARCRSADFRYADLRGANLRAANLSEVNFRLANLEGASLEIANTVGADFTNACLPDTFQDTQETNYDQWYQGLKQGAQENQSKIQSFLEGNDPESAFETLCGMYKTHQSFKFDYKRSWYTAALKLFAEIPVSATLIELIDHQLATPREDRYPVALDVFAKIAQQLPDDKFVELVDSALLALHKLGNLYLVDLGYRPILKAVEKRGMYKRAYEISSVWLEFLTENIDQGRFLVKSYQTAYKKQNQLESIRLVAQ